MRLECPHFSQCFHSLQCGRSRRFVRVLNQFGWNLFSLALIALGVETALCARYRADSLGFSYQVIPVIPWLPAVPSLAYVCGVILLMRRRSSMATHRTIIGFGCWQLLLFGCIASVYTKICLAWRRAHVRHLGLHSPSAESSRRLLNSWRSSESQRMAKSVHCNCALGRLLGFVRPKYPPSSRHQTCRKAKFGRRAAMLSEMPISAGAKEERA